MSNTYGLGFPIVKHPLGLFHTSTDLDVLKADLMVLLLTNPGERVMLPAYGTPLRQYFFEPNDPSTAEQVKELISHAIQTWEPRITVENIEVSTTIDESTLNPNDTLDQVDHILYIKISFYDPNNIAKVDNLVLSLPLTGGT